MWVIWVHGVRSNMSMPWCPCILPLLQAMSMGVYRPIYGDSLVRGAGTIFFLGGGDVDA